jgi:phenylalanyl-tRNA synthetase beta subunit
LLDKIHLNIKAGFDHFTLFEINPIHIKDHLDEGSKLPIEDYRLGMVAAADNQFVTQNYQGAAYYEIRKYADNLLSHFGIKFVIEPLGNYQAKDTRLITCLAPFEPARTALVKTPSGDLLGVIGEFSAAVRSEFKLPKFTAGAELSVEQILKYKTAKPNYEVLPRFPSVEQDICLRVSAECDYRGLNELMTETIDDKLGTSVRYTLEPLDIYQSDKDPSHKQVTLRLDIASFDKTMTAEEVNDLLDQIASQAKLKFKAVRI